MALTDRQKQIADMQKQGKKAPEIAAALSITTNAVYQQLRRMRNGKSAPKTNTGKKAPAPKAATPSTGSSTPSVTVTQKPTRPLTPLQSIRGRRDEINGDIKAAAAERDSIARQLTKAQEAVDKVTQRYADELASLDGAEAALTGKPVAGATTVEPAKPQGKPASATTPRPKAGTRGGQGRKNGASAAKPAEAATTPSEPAAAAQAAPAPSPAADSAPSAPTTQQEREASADFEPAVTG
jgi:hypothetical protein